MGAQRIERLASSRALGLSRSLACEQRGARGSWTVQGQVSVAAHTCRHAMGREAGEVRINRRQEDAGECAAWRLQFFKAGVKWVQGQGTHHLLQLQGGWLLAARHCPPTGMALPVEKEKDNFLYNG